MMIKPRRTQMVKNKGVLHGNDRAKVETIKKRAKNDIKNGRHSDRNRIVFSMQV